MLANKHLGGGLVKLNKPRCLNALTLNNNKNLSLIVGILLILVIGISFGYFVVNVNSNGESETVVGETVTLKGTTLDVEGTLEFSDIGILPGHKNVSSIKVTATGTDNIIYNVVWIGTNELNTPLTYKVYKTTEEYTPSITCAKKQDNEGLTVKLYEECTENNFDNLGGVVASGTIGSNNTETKYNLIINEEVQASSEGEVSYYYFVLEYPNLQEEQNSDIGSSFNGKVNAEILGEKEKPIVNVNVESSTMVGNEWYSEVAIKGTSTNSTNTISSIKYCVTSNEICEPDTIVNGNEVVVELKPNKNAQKVCFKGIDNKGIGIDNYS